MIGLKYIKTIDVDISDDWEIIKPHIIQNLNWFFKAEGLISSIENNELIYKRNFNRTSDIVLPSSRKDFFKILTYVKIQMNDKKNKKVNFKFIVDLRYLVFFSFALILIFSIGFYPLFYHTGISNYFAIVLLVAFLSGLIGYFSIRSKIAFIIKGVFTLTK